MIDFHADDIAYLSRRDEARVVRGQPAWFDTNPRVFTAKVVRGQPLKTVLVKRL